MPKITLSRHEAAEALSLDVQTIDRMIKAKELHASKLRRRVVIRTPISSACSTRTPLRGSPKGFTRWTYCAVSGVVPAAIR